MQISIATNGKIGDGTMAILPMLFDRTNINDYTIQGIKVYCQSRIKGPLIYQYIGEGKIKQLIKTDWIESKEDPNFGFEYYFSINSKVLVNNSIYKVIDDVDIYRYQEAYTKLGVEKCDVPGRIKVTWILINA